MTELKVGSFVRVVDLHGKLVPAIITEVVSDSVLNLRVFWNYNSASQEFGSRVPYGTAAGQWQYAPDGEI
jgi:hypothetical protein